MNGRRLSPNGRPGRLIGAVLASVMVGTLAQAVVAAAPSAEGDEFRPDRVDVAMARERAASRPELGVDLLIDAADAPAWFAANQEHPGLFDGLNIGIQLADVDEDAARTGETRLRAGADPGSLTAEERAAIMRAGGPAARLLDEGAAREEAARQSRPDPGPAACTKAPSSLRPTDSDVVVYLACYGIGPARPVLVRGKGASSPQERLEAALDLLMTASPEPDGQGRYSVLAGLDPVLQGATVGDDVVEIHFTSELSQLGFDVGLSTSSIFLEQVLRTVFANTEAAELRMYIEKDCEAFNRAMGGDDGCHYFRRGDHPSQEE